jgi:ATP-dependent protease ClpP protease subunit
VKAKKDAVPYLTPAQVRTQATMLDGSASRARAALESTDSPETPDSAGTTGELWLYGVVGGWWRGFDAESVSNALRGLDVDTLYVRIHSPGGHAHDGVAIANLLRNHKSHVVVVVDGLAASAASVIAVAGDEVIMCPGAQMMLHDASCMSYGNEAQLRSDADWIGKQSQNYSGVYAFRAGGTPEQWRQVMLADDGRGTWYTADEAVSAKLADKVGTVVAVGSPPVAPEDDAAWDDELLARAAHDLELLEHYVHPAARAVWSGVQPPKPPNASAVGSIPTEGGTAMAFTPEQLTTMRSTLELPETADEAAVVAAVEAVVAENLEDRAPTAGVPDGHVVIPQAKLVDLEEGAKAGLAAKAELHEKKREDFLDANKGRYAPASRAAWAKEYDRDPVATAEHFKTAPVLVPTEEAGHAEDTDTETPVSLADIQNDPTYLSWKVS